MASGATSSSGNRQNQQLRDRRPHSRPTSEMASSELIVVTTPPPQAGAGSPTRWWWILAVMIGLGVLLVISTVALNVVVLRRVQHLDKDFTSQQQALGAQAAAFVAMQSAGNSPFSSSNVAAVLAPVPQLQYVTLSGTNGTRMAYRARGDCTNTKATVVLFIHNVGLSSGQWVPLINHLAADGYCCVAMDLLGHGNSDAATGLAGGSYVAQATYVRNFIVSLGVMTTERSIYMVGDAFGAVVAAQYVATNPGDVDKLFVISPLPFLIAPEGVDFVGASNHENISYISALAVSNQTAYAIAMATYMLSGDTCTFSNAARTLQQSIIQVTLYADTQALSDAWMSLTQLDHRTVYQSMSIPISMAVGANYFSPLFDAVRIAEYARDLTANGLDAQVTGGGSSLYVIGGAGSMPQVTHEGIFNDIIDQFFSSMDTACDSSHPSQFVL